MTELESSKYNKKFEKLKIKSEFSEGIIWNTCGSGPWTKN